MSTVALAWLSAKHDIEPALLYVGTVLIDINLAAMLAEVFA